VYVAAATVTWPVMIAKSSLTSEPTPAAVRLVKQKNTRKDYQHHQ